MSIEPSALFNIFRFQVPFEEDEEYVKSQIKTFLSYHHGVPSVLPERNMQLLLIESLCLM